MDGHPHRPDRRPLICSAVAAGVLGLVWLLPSAHADGDDADGTSGVMPVEHTQPHVEPDQ
ncbi:MULTISPECIES: hypothetical protein [unclassified Streptomyces]|uniref:Secreted protein n=1 Tax=Streptomyces johnsoniae TaxID=3075532 RepID=A0ABU2SDD5_9ACTN|nr:MULTISPECIES: hypothetical protein [unclassified Streptomyces]MDT0446993.1 hypothetical protein [Streptomyces sp. DSM 41886]ONK11874.1 hypothetical protein STBA_26100 [Streptomyces sp. MP131-18]